MEERIQPLAHKEALSPLDFNLLSGKGSKKNEECDDIGDGPECPNARNAGSHLIGEIVLLNVEHVYRSVPSSCNC